MAIAFKQLKEWNTERRINKIIQDLDNQRISSEDGKIKLGKFFQNNFDSPHAEKITQAIGEWEAAHQLSNFLHKNPDTPRTNPTIEALEKIGTYNAADELGIFLRDYPNSQHTNRTIEALGKIGTDKAANGLVQHTQKTIGHTAALSKARTLRDKFTEAGKTHEMLPCLKATTIRLVKEMTSPENIYNLNKTSPPQFRENFRKALTEESKDKNSLLPSELKKQLLPFFERAVDIVDKIEHLKKEKAEVNEKHKIVFDVF